jgi:carbon storage regulator
MLVLTRQLGEQIVIDGNIILTVVAIDGNKIRLGIQAPKSVCVDRAEVHNRRLAEQASAAWTSSENRAGALVPA